MHSNFRWALAAGVLAAPVIANAALLATFDSFVEGDVFDDFVDGGIRFYNVSNHQTSYTNFAIEDASAGGNAGYSAPNVLGFGGYLVGPGTAYGAFGEMWFTSNSDALTAGLDLYTLPLGFGGNTITLTGYRNNQVVDFVSHTFGNSSSVIHQRFDLPEDSYDLFRLSSDGPAVMGDSFIDVDNVMVDAVPEPASVMTLALGAAALLRRCR